MRKWALAVSFNLQRGHNFPDYTYGDYFYTLAKNKNYSKYSQEKGRNSGEITLELFLKLFNVYLYRKEFLLPLERGNSLM